MLELRNKNSEEYSDEDFDDIPQQRGSKNLFETTHRSTAYDYYLDTPIGDKSKYRDLLHTLYNMEEGDSLRLFVSGPGGQLDTMLEIITAVESCRGRVIGVLTGTAASAHGILALALPELQVLHRASIMIHNASFGAGGKVQEVQSMVDYSIKVCKEVFEEFYTGFLSETELADLFKGVDFYFNAQEIQTRLKKRNTYRKKQINVVKKKTTDN
jgi:ATP-dependent protease ClpP protease subunit